MKPKRIKFTDNKGQVVILPDNLTLNDLAVLGIRLKLEPKGSPLKDGWFCNPPNK